MVILCANKVVVISSYGHVSLKLADHLIIFIMCPLCHRTIVLWLGWSDCCSSDHSVTFEKAPYHCHKDAGRGESAAAASRALHPARSQKLAELRSEAAVSRVWGCQGQGQGWLCEYSVLCNVTVCNQNSVFVTIANRQSSWTMFK